MGHFILILEIVMIIIPIVNANFSMLHSGWRKKQIVRWHYINNSIIKIIWFKNYQHFYFSETWHASMMSHTLKLIGNDRSFENHKKPILGERVLSMSCLGMIGLSPIGLCGTYRNYQRVYQQFTAASTYLSTYLVKYIMLQLLTSVPSVYDAVPNYLFLSDLSKM